MTNKRKASAILSKIGEVLLLGGRACILEEKQNNLRQGEQFMSRSVSLLMAIVCVFALPLCMGCYDSPTAPAPSTSVDDSKTAERQPLEQASSDLTEPDHRIASVGENLINDPSLEDAAPGGLPRGWSTYLNDGPNFRCEVVAGGRTGNQCLQTEGKGIRAVVFTNGVPLDRTKRYALKGWAKFEGDENARAIIKFNYFHNRKWLGVSDLIGIASNQEGWQLLEKTDVADDFPEASQIWVSCNVEGGGKAWFDDLELVAYHCEGLSADFDSQHGKDNLASRLLVLDRWLGQWESKTTYKPTEAFPRAGTTVSFSNAAKILDDRFLQLHTTSEAGDEDFLTLITYDENSAAYRLWIFLSTGAFYERIGQWDATTNTLTFQLVPPAPGVIGTSITRFVGNDTVETSLIVKNPAGVVTRDMTDVMTRKAEGASSDIPPTNDVSDLSFEQKVLDRHLGNWKQTATAFPAQWTPKRTESTGAYRCTRVLNGRFVYQQNQESDGSTHVYLYTYDAQRKHYRQWYFSSVGHTFEATGEWNGDANVMTWQADMGNGLMNTATTRFVDSDAIQWNTIVKSQNGELFFHGEGKSTRAK